MEKFKIIKQLEYLIAFQNECLNGGDWDNFDKSEMAIKKIEEALINTQESEFLLQDIDLKNILDSLQSVSGY
ncbi:MAG: hypothetical protein Q7S18_00840 [bacterium]|nr:hypothetical protein [bacterium]